MGIWFRLHWSVGWRFVSCWLCWSNLSCECNWARYFSSQCENSSTTNLLWGSFFSYCLIFCTKFVSWQTECFSFLLDAGSRCHSKRSFSLWTLCRKYCNFWLRWHWCFHFASRTTPQSLDWRTIRSGLGKSLVYFPLFQFLGCRLAKR